MLIVALLALVACGSENREGSDGPETVVVVQTETVEIGGEDGQTEGGGSATDGSGGILPDLVGERLDVAESDLDDLGIAYEEIGGGTFGVVVASNWIVCAQKPAAGEQAATVELIVARKGKCDSTTQQGGSGGSDESIPDLVGVRLDIAEDELDDLGIAYEEVGGGTFGIIDRTAWEVCETRPGAGEPAQVVKLIVERPGEC